MNAIRIWTHPLLLDREEHCKVENQANAAKVEKKNGVCEGAGWGDAEQLVRGLEAVAHGGVEACNFA
jgi:hypothetical protein